MSTPTVSVIVPAFNAAEYIEDTLRNALSQSLVELEVLVIDDASSDDTRARVRRVCETDPRVRLLVNTRNRGPAHARNMAIDAAAGRWIALLDSDDRMRPNRLEAMTRAAEAGGFDLLADDVHFVRSHGEPAFDRLFDTSLFSGTTTCEIDARAFLALNPPGGTRGLGLIKPIVRVNTLRESKIRYREEMRLAEDLFFYLDLLLSHKRLGLLRDGMYDYLVRSDSLARTKAEIDIARMIQSYDSIISSDRYVTTPEVRASVMNHKHEMESYSLPKHKLMHAIKNRHIGTCFKILWDHPILPFQMFSRQLSSKQSGWNL